jgi:hypothetical protein
MAHVTSMGVTPDAATVAYVDSLVREHGLVRTAARLGLGVATVRVLRSGGRVRPGSVAQVAMVRQADELATRIGVAT